MLFGKPDEIPSGASTRSKEIFLSIMRVAAAGASTMPGAAWLSPSFEAFCQVLGFASATRASELLDDILSKLEELSSTIEKLRTEEFASRPEFTASVMFLVRSYQQAQDDQKREFYRNAAVNVALGVEPEGSRRDMFLRILDRLTPLHLAILKFADDPEGACRSAGVPFARGSQFPVGHVIQEALPWVRTKLASPADREAASGQALHVILKELSDVNLIGVKSSTDKVPTYTPWTRHFGRDFLDFISEPHP